MAGMSWIDDGHGLDRTVGRSWIAGRGLIVAGS